MAQRLATVIEIVGPVGGASPSESPGVAPEFRDLPVGTIELWSSIAALHVDSTVWGDRLSIAHALLTAHLLTTLVGADGLGGSESGPVASEALGPASVAYGALTASALSSGTMSSSSYGRAFEAIRETIRHKTAWHVGNPYAGSSYLRGRRYR